MTPCILTVRNMMKNKCGRGYREILLQLALQMYYSLTDEHNGSSPNMLETNFTILEVSREIRGPYAQNYNVQLLETDFIRGC